MLQAKLKATKIFFVTITDKGHNNPRKFVFKIFNQNKGC